MNLIVSEFLSLDGVMQAPGDSEEDRSAGFEHGGWQMRHDLVDEYRLMFHPLVLGSGKRLFRDGNPRAALRLIDSTTSSTGVLILTYRPAREQ